MKGSFEQRKPLEKFKEFAYLFSFIAVSTLISTVIMDFVAFPLTVFADKNKTSFNMIFLTSSAFLFLGIILYTAFKIFIFYKKSSVGIKGALYDFAKKTFSLFLSAASFILLTAVILVFIYLLLSYNYFTLHEILN